MHVCVCVDATSAEDHHGGRGSAHCGLRRCARQAGLGELRGPRVGEAPRGLARAASEFAGVGRTAAEVLRARRVASRARTASGRVAAMVRLARSVLFPYATSMVAPPRTCLSSSVMLWAGSFACRARHGHLRPLRACGGAGGGHDARPKWRSWLATFGRCGSPWSRSSKPSVSLCAVGSRRGVGRASGVCFGGSTSPGLAWSRGRQ